VEAAGIPTVTVSVLPTATEAFPAPRNVIVRFRLGQVFGEPGQIDQQKTILRDALSAFGSIGESGGRVELPYRWKRHHYASG
jgi:hypothetical protein